MGDNWLTAAMSASWLPAAAAFVFGLAAGWFVWGGRRARLAELERSLEDADAKLSFTSAPDDDKEEDPQEKPVDRKKAAQMLDALENELKAARNRLEHDAEEQAALADGLTALDQAITRANARLKLILKAVKTGGNGE